MFYELEFKRSLHCWDFSFIMRPIGFNKGFSLKINLSKPAYLYVYGWYPTDNENKLVIKLKSSQLTFCFNKYIISYILAS